MSISTIGEIRTLGRLPDIAKLPDAVVQPHLDSAVSEMKRLVGSGYASSTGEKLAACKEAEICFTIANLLPVMNTFFPQEASVVQKQIGDTDFIFHDPDNLMKMVEYWRRRAMEKIETYLQAASDRQVYWGAV